MNTDNIHKLLNELLQIEGEQTWLEFKTNVAKHKASVTPEGIGEYISALSNGATISNKEFGYLILGIEDETQPVNFNKKPYIRINSQKTDLRNYPAYVRYS